MLQGMQDALARPLAAPAGPGATSLKSLPLSPTGQAGERGMDGPAFGKGAGSGPPAEGGAMANVASGGTAAGGVGAGAGGPGATKSALAADGRALGERLDLGGTLDQKLAVVEVIKRMSGGAATADDSAAATMVVKASKAAEAEAARSEEVPPEWRATVEKYFQQLSKEKKR